MFADIIYWPCRLPTNPDKVTLKDEEEYYHQKCRTSRRTTNWKKGKVESWTTMQSALNKSRLKKYVFCLELQLRKYFDGVVMKWL